MPNTEEAYLSDCLSENFFFFKLKNIYAWSQILKQKAESLQRAI